MMRRALLAFLCVAAVAACSRAAVGSATGEPPAVAPQASAVQDADKPPVDGRLTAVSISQPTNSAAEALRLCVPDGKTALVSGMAQLQSARDIPQYAWFWGDPPELETEAAAWVVQFKGDLTTRVGTYHDPTCVVIDGVRTIFATGGITTADGKTDPRPLEATTPVMALPPLQP